MSINAISAGRAARWFALLAICAAYLHSGVTKTVAFSFVAGEFEHLGLRPAVPILIATIVTQLVASTLILAGWWRWLAALALAGFTGLATLMVNRFWELPMPARVMPEIAFFEHIGLVGAFLLIAWMDVNERVVRKIPLFRAAKGGGREPA